jgi:hypothetical protein
MLSTDPTKDVSWILYGTKRRTSLRPSHLRDLLNTKSSSSMRQITQATTYNSYYGRILRHFITTADSSSPATIRTKLLNLFTPDVQSLTSPSKGSKEFNLREVSFSDFNQSWTRKGLNMIKKSLLNLYQNTSQIFVGSSTNVKGMLREGKLTRAFLHLSQTSL